MHYYLMRSKFKLYQWHLLVYQWSTVKESVIIAKGTVFLNLALSVRAEVPVKKKFGINAEMIFFAEDAQLGSIC